MKICLSMIVKDEERVIARCLEAVRPHIDTWAIVDTGSTDGTIDVIRETMAGFEGTLEQQPWVDFATNRTQALELARRTGCDYALVIDADDVLQVPEGFTWPADMKDGAMMVHDLDGMLYWRTQVFRLSEPWEYRGVVHEYPWKGGQPESLTRIHGPKVLITRDGARSREPNAVKYGRDAELLERALEEDPSDTRSAFYYAQSLRDAGRLEDSVQAYRRRARMGGYAEEVWFALFQIAVVEHRLDRLDWEVIADLYLQAYRYRPKRAEPLISLAAGYRQRGDHAQAFLYASAAVNTPQPSGELLFVDPSAYTWRKFDELSMAAHGIGHREVARTVGEYALTMGPDSQETRLRRNLTYSPGGPEGYLARHELTVQDREHWLPLIAELRGAYADVTLPGQPASDEVLSLVCATLASLVKRIAGQRPVRVLDMGSGLSSAVLRRCAAELEGEVDILSVDDSPQWLEKTRAFLEDQGLAGVGRLSAWADAQRELEGLDGDNLYDLVLYDLGNIPTRAQEFDKAIRYGTTVILDDMHRRELDEAARAALSRYSVKWELYNLRPITFDSFKRFAWALLRMPEIQVVVRNEVVESDAAAG